jgi:hypothetical protein
VATLPATAALPMVDTLPGALSSGPMLASLSAAGQAGPTGGRADAGPRRPR